MVMEIERAIKSLWVGRMKVIVKEPVPNTLTKKTSFQEKTIIENEPCRLSFLSTAITEDTTGAAEIGQSNKIFCDTSLDIPPGSKIIIEHNHRIKAYERSGEPAFYTYHQEIPVKPFVRWA